MARSGIYVKIGAAILGLAIVCTAMGIGAYFGSLYSPDKKQYQPVSHNQSKHSDYHGPSRSLPDISGLPGPIERSIANPSPTTGKDHEKRDLAAQEAAALWAFWMTVFAGFGTVVTTIAALLLYQQIRLTREAVEETGKATVAMQAANTIAEQNAHRQMRPFVYPERAWFVVSDDYEVTAYSQEKNFGQTPALSKRGWTHIWVACFPLHDELPEAPADLRMSSAVIGPGASAEIIHPRGNPLNAESRERIEAGTAAIYFYGLTTYIDIFGKSHYSRYIYFASGKGSLKRGKFSPYMSGNVIDVD